MSKIIPVTFAGTEHVLSTPTYRAKIEIAKNGVNLNRGVDFDPLTVAVIGSALLNQEDPKRTWTVDRFAEAMDAASRDEQQAINDAVVTIVMDAHGLAWDGSSWVPVDADPPTKASTKTPSK